MRQGQHAGPQSGTVAAAGRAGERDMAQRVGSDVAVGESIGRGSDADRIEDQEDAPPHPYCATTAGSWLASILNAAAKSARV